MITESIRKREVIVVGGKGAAGGSSLKATQEPHRHPIDQGSELALEPDTIDALEPSDIAARGGVECYIEQIKRDSEGHHVAYREAQYDGYAKCCLVTELLQKDDAEWAAFRSHQIWKNKGRWAPKEADRTNALRFVLIRAITGIERAGAQQASKISRALTPLMQSGTTPHQIKQFIIAEGGLEKLAVRHAKPRVSPTCHTPDTKSVDPPQFKVSVLGKDPFEGYSVGTVLNAVIIIKDRCDKMSHIDILSFSHVTTS